MMMLIVVTFKMMVIMMMVEIGMKLIMSGIIWMIFLYNVLIKIPLMLNRLPVGCGKGGGRTRGSFQI